MFTVNGLARHLAQTSNHACIIWRDSAHVESTEASVNDATDSGHAEPYHFQGDLFSDDYTEADISWSDNESDEDEASSSDLDYDPSIHASSPSVLSSTFSDDSSPLPSPMSVDEPSSDGPAPHAAAENNLYHPAKIEYFKGHAGEALPDIGSTEFQAYDHELGLGSTSTKNPYHPFQTQMDWEIAKWAKLRGPSSTAFTELLAIDGVCIIANHLCVVLILL
jgi:hypothetical protein